MVLRSNINRFSGFADVSDITNIALCNMLLPDVLNSSLVIRPDDGGDRSEDQQG